jgi:hypothetical protein
MRGSTSFAILLAISAASLLSPDYVVAAAPERLIYSRLTSEQPDFDAAPPPELRAFWDGMKPDWFAEDFLKGGKVVLYCRQYAKDHPGAIRVIMKDRLGDSEAKEMVYSMVVSNLDQEESMPLLNSYASHGTDQQKTMANDFIADIEEFNRQAAFPEGNQYPNNRIPVTNSPAELRKFWKGIDKQWLDTWSKTDLLSDYCLKYAQTHPGGSQVKYMMEDLVAHPSDVRDLVYSRLVLAMNPSQAKAVLTHYSANGTSREKLIANDFLTLMGAGDLRR